LPNIFLDSTGGNTPVTDAKTENRKTPLYDAHVALKAKMIPFGGWVMPVSYEGVLAEHKTVREACGIFDVSHMGEVRCKGPEAVKFLQWLTINDINKLKIGGGQYSAILNDQAGMIDDLIIYRLAEDEFFICINASNRDKDFAWIKEKSKSFNVTVTNESDDWAQIAIQGPKSTDVLAAILSASDANAMRALPYTNIMTATISGKASLLARTGYTGEMGYELYIPKAVAHNTWMALLEHSPKFGVKPIGLGARDTLRLEACYLLYGNDMNDHVTPLEAGISWATKIDKGDFIGRDLLAKQKSAGVKRQIQAFKMMDDGIPRHGMKVFVGDNEVGEVTSGSVLPTVGGSGGMALVSTSLKDGDEFFVDIRGAKKRAKIVKRPLYAARTK
jgi:aminomethyltransferase